MVRGVLSRAEQFNRGAEPDDDLRAELGDLITRAEAGDDAELAERCRAALIRVSVGGVGRVVGG